MLAQVESLKRCYVGHATAGGREMVERVATHAPGLMR